MHNSDTGSSIYTRKMTIKNTRCVYFFSHNHIPADFCKIRLPSFPAKPGRMISVGDFERTHTHTYTQRVSRGDI